MSRSGILLKSTSAISLVNSAFSTAILLAHALELNNGLVTAFTTITTTIEIGIIARGIVIYLGAFSNLTWFLLTVQLESPMLTIKNTTDIKQRKNQNEIAVKLIGGNIT